MSTITLQDGTLATKVNPNTKAGRFILWDYQNRNHGSIYEAYEKPSYRKIRSYEAIKARAISTHGYNRDLKVVGKNCNFYTTVYSYTIDGVTTIVKDTASNIFAVTLQ